MSNKIALKKTGLRRFDLLILMLAFGTIGAFFISRSFAAPQTFTFFPNHDAFNCGIYANTRVVNTDGTVFCRLESNAGLVVYGPPIGSETTGIDQWIKNNAPNGATICAFAKQPNNRAFSLNLTNPLRGHEYYNVNAGVGLVKRCHNAPRNGPPVHNFQVINRSSNVPVLIRKIEITVY